MKTTWCGVALILAANAVACSEGQSGDDSGTGGTTSGSAGQSMGAAGQGGSGAGLGGSGGMGASGAGMSGMSSVAGAGPTCGDGTIACNGVCVGPGMPGGGCTVLATSGETASIDHGFSLDEAYVYWVEQGTRLAVSRVAKAGGTREDLLLPDDIPHSPSANSTSVFFSIGGFDENTLNSIPKAGGAPTVLATSEDEFKDVVATESRVYFSRERFSTSTLEVTSTALDGTDEILHATTGSFGANHTVVDATHVYFINDDFFDTPSLQRTTLDGSTVEAVAGITDLAAFALNGDSAVIYTSGVKRFYTVAKAGGAPTQILSPTEAPGSFPVLASAGAYFYWTTDTGVWRAGLDGSNPVRLLATIGSVSFVAADASGVYAAVNTRSFSGPAFVMKLDQPG
jgi:hypothetical protein